jgi:diaminopimelate epimerase
MKLQFTKMHGLGNDFLVARWPGGAPGPDTELVRRLADRRLGVGFDQLLLIEAEAPAGASAAYRVFNADGGEVEQCGNGARCIAQFLAAGRDRRFTLASRSGPIEARVLGGGRVSVNLGVPDFRPASLPFSAPAERDRYRLEIDGQPIEFGAVSMGNPHAVIEVDSVDGAPVGILGPALQQHRDFPRSVNVGFMEVMSASGIRLRVYERGVGETLACGTGAAAAVAVGRRWDRLGDRVEVTLPGGVLTVEWAGPGEPLWQTGPATAVYEGQIEL